MTDAASSEKEVRRWVVRGAVQRVGFRMFVMREATKLGLRGTVRNTKDGAVDTIAAGTPERLDQLENRLKSGPELATVQSVERLNHETSADEFANTFMIVS